MTNKTITTKQIEGLRSEAAQAGDSEQVRICDAALDGDAGARAECARVVADAAAMQEFAAARGDEGQFSAADVVVALAPIADAHAQGDVVWIRGYAPDCTEYGGSTEPGSPWDEECDARLAAVADALPSGWRAVWCDDDVEIAPLG